MNAPFLAPAAAATPNLLLGSAAAVLASLPASFVDMTYIDPPFGNRQVWSGKAGKFDDRWRPTDVSRAGWEALERHNPIGAKLMSLIARTDHDRGYLGFMAGLILAGRRALKPTGSLWLHFDDTLGAPLRLLAEAVFGLTSCLGLIIWKRTGAHSHSSRCFGRVHDTIAVYARTRATAWRLHRCEPSDLVYGDPARRTLRVDGFAEERLTATSRERVGYPTQKPIALLSRFISAATLPGDLVLDPTCGSGTTLVAATRLDRRSLGIDASADAIACARSRIAREAA